MPFGSKFLFSCGASFAGSFINGCFEFLASAVVLFDVVLGDWFEFVFLIVGQLDFGIGKSFEVVGNGDGFSFLLFLVAVSFILAVTFLVVAGFVVVLFLGGRFGWLVLGF